MGASNFTSQVDNVFLFVSAISVALLFLITFLMIFFVFKYNKKRNPRGEDIHGNIVLELIWTTVPVILVLAMFYYGMVGYRDMKTIPEDTMNIKVTGRMWSWMYTYENGLQTDSLFVPVNKPIRLELESLDVIHSFYVPAFRIKQDVVPGQTFDLWFTPQKTGTYEVMCAEYCGMQHSYMLSKLVAMEEDKYSNWFASASQDIPAVAETEPGTGAEEAAPAGNGQRGAMLVQNKGCLACHTTDGSQLVGPSFKGMFGKSEVVLVNGEEREVTVDEEYLRESIMQPNVKIVKGFQPLMPSMQGQLNEQELEAIVQYIKELQ